MAKLIKRVVEYYMFYCSGCKYQHTYSVFEDGSQWKFNGDMGKASFIPSLLNRIIDQEGNETSRCHLFVTDGQIIYCADCTHELAGQTIELSELG